MNIRPSTSYPFTFWSKAEREYAEHCGQWEDLADAREWQERRARVNNECTLTEAGIGLGLQPGDVVSCDMGDGVRFATVVEVHDGSSLTCEWHQKDPRKPCFTWRDAWPVIATWVAVVTTAVCLYILARALVAP